MDVAKLDTLEKYVTFVRLECKRKAWQPRKKKQKKNKRRSGFQFDNERVRNIKFSMTMDYMKLCLHPTSSGLLPRLGTALINQTFVKTAAYCSSFAWNPGNLAKTNVVRKYNNSVA